MKTSRTEAPAISTKQPLLLPAGNSEHNRELSYEEQDIQGYTIAEAHAALEAFKRHRKA